MDETSQRARLDKVWRVATALLLVILLLMLLALALRDHPASQWLKAFAEAALAGGLADWFAVTALFRHPLGLRIPHTAIIPSNRDRLAEGIAHFLEQNFLTPQVLEHELAAVDAAMMLGQWLSSPVHRRWLVCQILRQGEEYVQVGPLLAEVLRRLVEQGKHEQWFDQLAGLAIQALNEQQSLIYQKVSEKSPRWMPRRFNDEFFQRLVEGIAELLADMQEPDSTARGQFAEMLEELATRLEKGEDVAASMTGLLDTRRIPRQIESQLQTLAQRLVVDPVLGSALNRTLRDQAAGWLYRQRHQIAGVARRVVMSWDDRSLVDQLELHTGRDLQFIRINGTVVGGFVGLLLHGLGLLAGAQ